MAKFNFYASTGYVNCEREEIVEVPDEELEGMDEFQVENYVWDNYFKYWMQDNLELSIWRVD